MRIQRMKTFFLFSCFTLVALWYAGCTNQQQISTVEVSIHSGNTDTLTAVEYSAKELILNPKSIVQLNDRFLVVLDDVDNGLFKLYSLPELNYLYSWGRRGRGPGEFAGAGIIANNLIADSLQIEIYNYDLQRLDSYSVSEDTIAFIGASSLSYQNQHESLNAIRKLSDDLYIAHPGMREPGDPQEKVQYIALQPDNDTPLFHFGTYPENSLKPIERPNSFRSATTTGPGNNSFIAFYEHHNSFRVYDSGGKLKKEFIVTDSLNQGRDISSDHRYRVFATSSDSLIYSYYVNDDISAIMAQGTEYNPMIEVWDSQGNPVRRFRLDRAVHYFTISDTYEKLYGISFSEPGVLYEYDLTH